MPAWVQTLTVDASYDHSRGVTGIGIVVQERTARTGRGRVVEQIAEAHRGIQPGSGEKFAVCRALEIAIERGYTRVKIRCDYNWMRRRLRAQRAGRHSCEGDDLGRKVLELSTSLLWVDFSYVPRRKNQRAHQLAREGRCREPAPASSVGTADVASGHG